MEYGDDDDDDDDDDEDLKNNKTNRITSDPRCKIKLLKHVPHVVMRIKSSFSPVLTWCGRIGCRFDGVGCSPVLFYTRKTSEKEINMVECFCYSENKMKRDDALFLLLANK